MTITLDIKPEIEEELLRRAAELGLEIGPYAASVLEEVARKSSSMPRAVSAKDMVELFAPLRGLNLDFDRDKDPGRDIQL